MIIFGIYLQTCTLRIQFFCFFVSLVFFHAPTVYSGISEEIWNFAISAMISFSNFFNDFSWVSWTLPGAFRDLEINSVFFSALQISTKMIQEVSLRIALANFQRIRSAVFLGFPSAFYFVIYGQFSKNLSDDLLNVPN